MKPGTAATPPAGENSQQLLRWGGILLCLTLVAAALVAWQSSRWIRTRMEAARSQDLLHHLKLMEAHGTSSPASNLDALVEDLQVFWNGSEPPQGFNLLVLDAGGRVLLDTGGLALADMGSEAGVQPLAGGEDEALPLLEELQQGSLMSGLMDISGHHLRGAGVALKDKPVIVLVHQREADLQAGISRALRPGWLVVGGFFLLVVPLVSVLFMVLYNRDRRKQQSAMETMARERQGINRVLKRFPVVLWSIDREGLVNPWQGDAEGLLGLDLDALQGQHYQQAFADHPKLIGLCRQALDGVEVKATLLMGDHLLDVWLHPYRFAQTEVGGVVVTALDASEREQAEEALQYRLRMETLVAEVSAQFLRESGQGIEGQILRTLSDLGRFSGAERSFLLVVDPNTGVVENGFEWVVESTRRSMLGFQGKSQRDLPWYRPGPRQEDWALSTRHDWNEVPEPLRNWGKKHGIQSLLCIPLQVAGTTHGFLGLQQVSRERSWSDEDTALLKVLGEVVTGALKREQEQLSLARSEELFHAAFSYAPIGVALTNRRGVFVEVNRAFCEMMGYTAEEFCKLSPLDITPEETHQEDKDRLAEMMAGKLNFYSDQRMLVKKNGEPIWVNLSAAPVLGPEGKVEGMVGQFQDITFTLEAQDSLRKSEEKFKTAFTQAAAGVVLSNKDGIYLEVNQTFADMLGYEPEEMRGRSFLDFTHPEDGEVLVWGRENLLADRIQSYRSKKRYIHKDGRQIWTEVTVGVLRNADGVPDMFVGHILDVTRREKAEASLHYLVQLENMLTDISTGFINLPLKDMDRGINQALSTMGLFLSADRVQLFRFSEDLARADNTHEWTAEGVKPNKDRLQNIDTRSFPGWMQALSRHQVIHIPDVASMDPAERMEQDYLESQDIGSCLAVPVVSQGEAKGFLVLDVLHQSREWSDEERQIMGVIGDVFAQALTRLEAEQRLRQRVRFLDFLSRTSSEFLNMAPGSRSRLMDQTLKKVGEFLAADRVQVLKFESGNAGAKVIQEWCRAGVEERIDKVGVLDLTLFSYWTERIRRMDIISIPDVNHLPGEAKAEMDYLMEVGITAVIGVPMVTRGRAIGWLAIDMVGGPREWSQEEKRFLRVVGDIFAGTLEREAAQEELANSEERFKSAFNQTLLGMLLVSPQGHFLQGNQALADLLGCTVGAIPEMDWSQVTHDEDLERTRRVQREFLTGTLSSYTDERRVKCKDGTLKWISLGISPLRDPGGRVRFFIAQMLDITERKEAELALDAQVIQEQLLSEISGLFLSVGLPKAEDPIQRALHLLGEYTGSDRIHLVTMNVQEQQGGLHTEWCAQGVGSVAEVLQNLPMRELAAWVEELEKEKELTISDGEQLGEDMAFHKGFMDAVQCRSFLTTPLLQRGQMVGALAMAMEKKPRVWPREWRRFLRIVADVLANALEREEARRALVASEEKWRSLVQNAPEIVVTVDRKGRVEFINRPLFGFTPEALIGKRVTDPVLPQYHPAVDELMGRVFEKGEVGRLEVEGLGSQGKVVWYEAHIGPVTMGDEVVAATVLISDISNRKLAEEALQRSKEELEGLVSDRTRELSTANDRLRQEIADRRRTEDELFKIRKLESLGVLAGGIAHDFNNMLTTILGNTSLARSQAEMVAPEVVTRLVHVENAAHRAQTLTRQLLTFSKGGAPVTRVVNLAPVVQEAAGFALRGAGVQVEFDMEDRLPAVEADEGQISQAIHNLVLNAQQAMEDRGRILVRCREVQVSEGEDLAALLNPGRYLRITIRDEGPGIPEEQLSQIFDPYFTTKPTGMGLGLATSYSIMTRHQGHLAVDSEVGEGTSMHLYLPVTDKTLPVEPQEEELVPAGQGRVLVMDDEEGIRSVLGMMLETLGYESAEAADGRRAVELYRQAMEEGEPFFAVVMDLTVPGGMGGREAVKLILDLDPEAQVVVSSGYSRDPVLAEHRTFGFVDLLPKPYKLKDLAAVLAGLPAKTPIAE